ncbi:MAG TPA: hypothetical protein VJ303_13640 [Steroidobacteraceae bacterium]|jgi:hypothetical protein|nr:hypothetical protein [Steroidobacteraceae bacterium]
MLTRLVQSLVAVSLFIASPAVSAATDDPLVVHEWGTFTTVQGADSEQIWWRPPASVDLPDFVYRAAVGGDDRPVTFNPKDLSALARMETPVIYFYSERERVADVRVLFRGGNLTEWYPQPTRVAAQSTEGELYTMPARDTRQFTIEWNGVKILARDTREMALDKLIRSKGGAGDHYYIARDTDANFLRVAAPQARSRVEHERDLFYRGLGYFQAPLAVGMDADEQALSLNAREAERIETAFLVSVRKGMMRYQKIEGAIANAASVIDPNTQPFGALEDVRKVALQDMARALVNAGLYAKEARAMVNTWQDQWFAEEGTRVLYLLPREWTDRTLQLQVSPQPDQIVRVMVGRAELITPSVERDLREQVLTYRTGDAKAKSRAVDNVRALGLGRFLYAASTRLIGDRKDREFALATGELMQAVSAREDERSARN